MTTLYWLMEYGKVFFAYVFIMFIWPSVVFRKYLKGKTLAYRFSFGVTVQIVIINTVVIGLGLIHLLKSVIVIILFYGVFLFCILKKVKISKQRQRDFRHLLMGTYGWKLLLANTLAKIRSIIKGIWDKFLQLTQKRKWEYFLLGIVVIFGMTYFSYGAFQDYSYGFGDMYPHNAWIYGLVNGQIFSAGVYPEGMHCFLYVMHTVFGIRIYSCLLFLAGIHSATFLVSACIMLKSIFRWRYTPILALTMFLTVDVLCIDSVYSMSRLQWTLPLEFGLFTLFLCAAYLLRYLRDEKVTKKIWDPNLIIFMLSLAASLTIHFYATIMAFFLCVAFVPMLVHKVFQPRRLRALIVTVICGTVIAVVPMLGALASGIPFQGSIGWAMNVIEGTDPETQGAQIQETDSENQGVQTQETDAKTQEIESETELIPEESNSDNEIEDVVRQEKSFGEKLQDFGLKLFSFVKEKAIGVYHSGYITLYKQERADAFLFFSALALGLWLVFRVIATVVKIIRRKKKKINAAYYDECFSLILASVIFFVLYAAGRIGFVSLIAGSRLCSVIHLLILSVICIPIDMIFTTLSLMLHEGIMKVAALLSMIGIYVGTIYTGTFHGYLYYELTRFNGAVMSTYSITESLPKNSFTIVSPVDELYQVIQYGYHEELVNFINESKNDDYMIPTEYVFIFVEKTPIEYAQSHFFEGPDWLAWEKYADYYNSYVSQCPDITTSEISSEKAAEKRRGFPNNSKGYSNLETRTILESNMYEWCREFEELYPNELHTYYEDENFVCYYFKQNVMDLYRLGIR